MKKDLLNIEIRLLIQKYGYQAIMQSLADIKETSIEEITDLVIALENSKKQANNPKKAKNDIDLILKQVANHDNSELLIELLNRFQNKTFLPQLKDVKRFLERLGMNVGNINLRASSAKKLFGKLQSLRKEELESILEEVPINGESAFSALANEIIGGPRNTLSNK